MLPSATVLTLRPSLADEDAAWDAFVAGHPDGHFLQSSAWARFRQAWGWSAWRLVVCDAAGDLVGGAQALVRRTPAGALTYIPRGPVCAPFDPDVWPLLHAGLRARARRESVALRLEPQWAQSPTRLRRLRSSGWREAEPVQPPSTIRIDLAQDESALLAQMKQKWRYNIQVARRHGITVREGGPADFDAFEALTEETAVRDGFGHRPKGYYAGVWQAFGAKVAHLYFAEHDGRPLAAILVLHFGHTATYLYGASSNAERQRMPNHLIQWEAMRLAKAAGCRWYDFWGIPDEIGRAAAVAGQTAYEDPQAEPGQPGREVDGAGVVKGSVEAAPGRDVETGLSADGDIALGTGGDDTPLPVRTEHVLAEGQGGLWGVWGFKRGFGGEVFRTVGAWDEVYAPWRYWMWTEGLPSVKAALRRRSLRPADPREST